VTSEQDIQVRLGEHGEYAEIFLSAAAGPSTVTPEALAATVRQAGVAVTEGVNKRLQAVAESFLSKPRAFSKVVATAKDPVHGVNGSLKWEAAFDQVTQPPQRRANSPGGHRPPGCPKPVNHYAGFRYVGVKAGEHVATITQPTAGTDGVDVCGQAIKARPGKPCEIRVDNSLTVLEDGKVISNYEGTLQFENDTLSVSDVLTVSGCVDFTTGNIKVNGSVYVKEHVRAMFSIDASGDVTVDGLVEAATINCTGNFYCRRGVTAKGRGKIVTGAAAEVGYLNDAHGTIGTHLSLRREAIDCEMTIKGDLHAEAATIIGGRLDIGGKAVIGTLGSRNGKHTTILPRGPLVVHRLIHHGVIFLLPTANSRVFSEAMLRDPVQGEVQLVRNEDGQWCFINAQKLVIPLADVATIQRRAAA
jgi:uncharacterized protein